MARAFRRTPTTGGWNYRYGWGFRASANLLESSPKRQLKRSGIAHRSDLLKCRRRDGGVNASAEHAVQSHAIHVIGEVESLRESLQAQPFRDLKAAAEARVQIE